MVRRELVRALLNPNYAVARRSLFGRSEDWLEFESNKTILEDIKEFRKELTGWFVLVWVSITIAVGLFIALLMGAVGTPRPSSILWFLISFAFTFGPSELIGWYIGENILRRWAIMNVRSRDGLWEHLKSHQIIAVVIWIGFAAYLFSR